MVGSKAKSKGTPSHTARESFGSLPPPAPRAADSGPSVSATSLGNVPPWSGTAPSATGTPAQTKQSYADALSQKGKNTGGKKGSGKKGKDLPPPRIMEEIAVQIYRTDVDLQVAAEMHKLNSAGCRDPFFLALWGDYERHGALPNGSQYEVITRCLENLCAAEAAMAAHTATQPAQSNADATASEAAQPASEAAQPSPCPILAASPKITAPKVTHGIAPSLANASPACSGLSGAPATATQAAQPTANPEIPPASGSAQQRQQQFASNPIALDAATLRPLVAEIVTAALHSGELANALANLPQAAPSNVPRPIPMSAPPPATAASVAPQQFVGFPTRSATVTMTTPGAHCSICGRYVRGGASAMSVHQATSSRCAAARGETTDGREPCPHYIVERNWQLTTIGPASSMNNSAQVWTVIWAANLDTVAAPAAMLAIIIVAALRVVTSAGKIMIGPAGTGIMITLGMVTMPTSGILTTGGNDLPDNFTKQR